MSSAEPAITRGTFVWTLSIAVLILGWLSFESLPRREGPEIGAKEMRITTPYPGASAAQVERQVSVIIEMTARELDQLGTVESYSSRGQSVVSVRVQDGLDKHDFARIRGELRHKIDNVHPQLPPGAGPSVVEDDDGVYGSYYALTGKGFTPAELARVAEQLRRELSTLDGAQKVLLFGAEQESIHVEISRVEANALGVSIEAILKALRGANLPADAGRIQVGPEHVPIVPGELFRSEQDLGDLMIAGSKNRLVRLGDVAEIRRDYADPPHELLRIDGEPAVGIAISSLPDRDAIAMGQAVERRLAQSTSEIPLGMELKIVTLESTATEQAMNDFGVRFAQALAMVMIALMLFLGLRGGLLIGLITLLTLAGTFLVMYWLRIALEPISLGALIIALGLIPANSILVVENMKQHIGRGLTGVDATREAVAENAVPLLAATAAPVLTFVPVAGLGDGTGGQFRPLFLIVLVTLAISWVTAVTAAPLLAKRLLAPGISGTRNPDPDDGSFHWFYDQLLTTAIRHRWILLGATALLVAISFYSFGFVERTYLPLPTSPTFLVEVQFREGTHIRETEHRMDEIQTYLQNQETVTQVATAIGSNHPHYSPGYSSGSVVGSHYGAALVFVDDQERIDAIRSRVQVDLEARFPDAQVNVKRYARTTETTGGRIQLRIGGPNPVELRRLADRVKTLITADPDAKAVHDDWGTKTKIAQPILAQKRVRRLGIDRAQITTVLRTIYSGTAAGFYDEGTGPIPIVARIRPEERSSVEDMAQVFVTSPLRGDKVSLRRLVDRLDTLTEDARRFRCDGSRLIRVHADAKQGSTHTLFERIKPRVEKTLEVDLAAYSGREPGPDFGFGSINILSVQDDKIPLKGKPGYFIAWGGEAESAAESRAELRTWIPSILGLTVLILIALFNALRPPLIALLTLPLAMVGVTAGLLVTGRPFDFPSLLGIMGLTGILIRDAILLLDQIHKESEAQETRLAAILGAAHSRLRPVGLAATVTILALLPLLQDALFASMAVTLISGLAFAALLTLVLVPLLYATLYRVANDDALQLKL